MNKKFILNSATILCIAISQLFSQYEVIDAFPNLTFNDPVGIYYAPDGTNRLSRANLFLLFKTEKMF